MTVAYAVDALLFTVSFWATWRLPPIPPIVPDDRAPKPTAGLRGIAVGLKFLVTQPVLLLSFGVDIIAMVFAMPRALFPEVAEERFGGGAAVGWLFSAIAIGSVIGGLTSGWIGRVRRQGVALVAAVVGWGVAIGLSGLAHQLWLMVLLLAVGGAADLVSAVYRQSILQTFAPDRLRGRLQGVFTWWWPAGPDWVTCGPARPPSSTGADRLLGGRRLRRGRAGRGAGRGVPGPDPLPARPAGDDRGEARPIVSQVMTSVAAARSGTQWSIEADGHRAVLVEVGGVLRSYSAGEREILDGFARRRDVARAPPARSWRRGPTGSATGSTRSRADVPARADRAGPAQRHPRPGQLVALARSPSRPPTSVTLEFELPAAGRLPVVADAADPLDRSAPTGCAATRRSTNTSDDERAVGLLGAPVPAAHRGAGGRHRCCRCRPAPGCWPTPGCCRSARSRSPAPSTTTPSRAGSARPCWTPRSATSTTTPTAAPRSTIAAPDSAAEVDGLGRREVQVVAGLHRRHPARRAAPPVGGDRADDLPAGRVPLRPRPDRAGARRRPGRPPGAIPAPDVEFDEVVRRRRMVRNYDPDRPVPPEVVDRIARARAAGALGRASPRAGASWCWRAPADRELFWSATTVRTAASRKRGWSGMRTRAADHRAAVEQSAYLDRYAEPDKGWTDRDEARWPVPYWDIDTGFAALLMHLTAVDEGLGVVLLRHPGATATGAFRAAFGVPDGVHPDRRAHDRLPGARQEVTVAARGVAGPVDEVVHHGRWSRARARRGTGCGSSGRKGSVPS